MALGSWMVGPGLRRANGPVPGVEVGELGMADGGSGVAGLASGATEFGVGNTRAGAHLMKGQLLRVAPVGAIWGGLSGPCSGGVSSRPLAVSLFGVDSGISGRSRRRTWPRRPRRSKLGTPARFCAATSGKAERVAPVDAIW